MDVLQPVLHNFETKGVTWKKYGITLPQVMKRIAPIREGSEALWEYASALVDDAVGKGYLDG